MSTEHFLFLLLQRHLLLKLYCDNSSVVHVSEYCFAVDYNLSSLWCSNHSNNIFPFCTGSIVLEVSCNLASRSEILCLSWNIRWKGGSQHSEQSAFSKWIQINEAWLFSCSHFLSFAKGRFIVCMLNCLAQSSFSSTILFLQNSESQTRSSAGMHAVQTLLHRRL